MRKQKKIQSIVERSVGSLDHPEFYGSVYEEIVAKTSPSKDPLQQLLAGEFVEINKELEKTALQESWCWRNVHIARELAHHLIDDQGHLLKNEIERAIKILQEHFFSLGPSRNHDVPRRKELLVLLQQLYTNERLGLELKKVSRPIGHQVAERLIRETLFLKETDPITDAHARRAVLSALFTKLRQNVGSCFATAPAILIQQEQPLQFLSDMVQLLAVGRLVRIYDGNEYTVPLSQSWGMGDLHRPFLLSSLGENPCVALSSAPGLLAAFQAAGVMEGQTKEEKKQACQTLLCLSPYLTLQEDSFVYLTPDHILQSVLLQYYRLSIEEVENFQNRPREGIAHDFILQQPMAKESKSRACVQFLKSYEKAKVAFKAIADHALLKAWEFTLASFSETKADFARWNLSASLGLHPEEKLGIGEAFHAYIQRRIEEINQEIEGYQSRCGYVFAQLQSLEGRVKRVSTESEMGWIQAEYQMRKFEYHRLTVERDELHDKGRKLVQLLPILLSFYSDKFKEYFQEVYDAEMHDVSQNPYDDSPAGFRLLYKHGRTNTSLWTMISTPAEFLQALSSFFAATEVELSHLPQVEGLENELSQLVSTAFLRLRQDEFLENSIERLARAYGERLIADPLENLSQVKRKPWSYISGGTMATLVSCYWGASKKIEEKTRWVENEMELLVFLLDVLKEMPRSAQKEFKENQEKSLLAFSPTHAFLCKPGWKKFKEGWQQEDYTYTWVRDQWVLPQQKFLSTVFLDFRMMDRLVDEIATLIPQGYRPHFKNLFRTFTHPMDPTEFRAFVLKTLVYEKWLQSPNRLEMLSEEIDCILYRSLPLFPDYQLREKLGVLFEHLSDIDPTIIQEVFANYDRLEEHMEKYKIFTADDLRRIAKTLLLLALQKTTTQIPFHQKITEAMQKSGLCLPEPILFADTNWVKNTFGFVVNPGTSNLELWRFDDCGSEGHPIRMWKQYVDGTTRLEWGLYSQPHQYSFF